MTDNQLVDEAEAPPDLDEFEGLSVKDIAHAITLWPEGSEDQIRAIAAIRARAPGLGHNRPPLDEALDEELEPHRARAGELIEVATTAAVIDDISAQKVTDLIAIIASLEGDLEASRVKRNRPYLYAQRLINDRYHAVIGLLRVARQGENGKGGLRGVLTQYVDRRDAEQEKVRQRLRAEAEERDRQAAAAREAAAKKAAEGGTGVAGELEAMRKEDEAEQLRARSEAIRPEPIRSHLGSVNRRREIKFEIDNLRSLLGWLIKQPGLQNSVRQAASTIIGSHLKSLGVDAVDRGVDIPGLTVSVVQGAANVRR